MSQSSKFHRLQQIDSQLDQVRQRLQEIHTILNDNAASEHSQAEVDSADRALQNAQKEQRLAENQVQDQKIKIGQNESTLYGGKVRNPKELQDLQNEATSLKKYLVVLEDKLLDTMLITEEAEAVAEQVQKAFAQLQGTLVEKHAHLRAEQTALQQNFDRLMVEHQVAESAVTGTDLELYNRLRRTRSGIAVAKIVDKTCSACGSGLPPALIQTAASSAQLAHCGTCGRILYAG